MFLRSPWFPPILAFLQTALFLTFITYDYWGAALHDSRFNVREFVQRDLARPFFEPSNFCGAYTHYGIGQSAVLGIDLPAYAGALLLHSVVNWRDTCIETLTAPRGQVVVVLFVLPLWYFLGLSIRRLVQHRWRPRTTGRLTRILVSFGLIPLPFGVLGLLFSFVGVFVSEIGLTVRLTGLAFWTLYLAILTAERLRFWPFRTERPCAP